MKKNILIFLGLICAMGSMAQTDTTLVKWEELSDTTAIGIPNGAVVNNSIGPGGGRINSSDGRVELIFPPGALTTPTTISIQATSNLAPNGNGDAYQLEPSGTRFKKPVRFVFHYTDEEAFECPPDLMGFAMQDHTGKWTFFDCDTWDSTAKTLQGDIYHFSSLAMYANFKIRISKKELCARDSTYVSILKVAGKKWQMGFVDPHDDVYWYVNDIRYGDMNNGYMVPEYDWVTSKKGDFQYRQGHYFAPDYLPVNNPVRITARITLRAKGSQDITAVKNLHCTVNIYDKYLVTVTHSFEARAAMGNWVSDQASFAAEIRMKKITLDEIQNQPAALTKKGSRMGCKLTIITDPPYCGTINITGKGIYNYQLSGKGPYNVHFEIPTPEVSYFRFFWTCKGGTKTDPADLKGTSVPSAIEFIANGEAQEYILPGNIKLLVKPYEKKE